MKRDLNVVGILTIEERYLLSNYGSFFQHWALRTVLQKTSCRVFRVARDCKYGSLMGFVAYVWHVLVRPRIGSLVRRRNLMSLNPLLLFTQLRSYVAFRRDFLMLVGAIREEVGCANVAIVGGDQPWNSDKSDIFLEEINSSAKKLAYSVCSDWSRVERNMRWRLRAQKELSFFDGISVREHQGVSFLSQLIPNKIISQCIDPTLLLTKSDYLAIAENRKHFSERVLLFYAVNIKSDGRRCIEKLRAVAAELGCRLVIVGIQGSDLVIPMKDNLRPSPRSFIRWYNDATYVITNSFHGIVFSTIFEKPFLFVSQQSVVGENQNARQIEFLSLIQQPQRVATWCDDVKSVKERLTSDVDWAHVRGVLEQNRRFSKKWLEGFVGGGIT